MAESAQSAPTVAALFVQAGGVYSQVENVEVWDKSRDARNYAGPHSVVAHPPCNLWGNLAAVNYARYGGEHNKPGNDGGLFSFAFNAVLKYGGVLEHPAKSKAFRAYGITPPTCFGWQRNMFDEWVCEVWQSAYGHRARKATWLFYSGRVPPSPLKWERPISYFQIGYHDQRGKQRNKPTLGTREAAATPPAFRDALINLARNANGKNI